MEKGNKAVRGEIKTSVCVIGHCVQLARMVENRWFNSVVLVVRQADYKGIVDNAVYGGGLHEGPSNGGSVISARGGGPTGRLPTNMGGT